MTKSCECVCRCLVGCGVLMPSISDNLTPVPHVFPVVTESNGAPAASPSEQASDHVTEVQRSLPSAKPAERPSSKEKGTCESMTSSKQSV